MKRMCILLSVALLACSACQAGVLVLTFDDIPPEYPFGLSYYYNTYQVGVNSVSWTIVDHSSSSWGPPNSGSNVIIKEPSISATALSVADMKDLRAYSIGAFFSTEYGAALRVTGRDIGGNVLDSALVGATDEAWDNVYVQVNSASGDMAWMSIRPVSTDALDHFCVDDVTVNLVLEPASISALALALAMGAGARRVGRRRG